MCTTPVCAACRRAGITTIMCSQGGVHVQNTNLCMKCSTPLRYGVQEGGGDDDDPPPLITRMLSSPRRQFLLSPEHRTRIHARFVVVILHTETKPDRSLYVLHCVATLLNYENQLSDRIMPCNASSSPVPFLGQRASGSHGTKRHAQQCFCLLLFLRVKGLPANTGVDEINPGTREGGRKRQYLFLTGKLKLEPCRVLSLHW